jgi:GH24 family phage-related lysozyme (muramidase)
MTLTSPTNFDNAATVVSAFEGFIERAVWDVNAWRLGYGSDTRTVEQIPVREGDVTTIGEAEANLAIRLAKFELVIRNQVTDASWDALAQNPRAALISLAYNYGSLTPTVAACVRTRKDLATIAAAVLDRRFDNAGVNYHRRSVEASLIRLG